MLILRSENNDPELVDWLNSLLEESSGDPSEQAKRLTHSVYKRFDRPERFRGQSIDVIGRVIHRYRARSFIKKYDRPLGYYLAGDIIRSKMAFARHRAALLFAALENNGYSPEFRVGLIHVSKDEKKVVNNVTHAWLTLKIDKDELILDPTFDVVTPLREVSLTGDRNPELKIAGVRYYPTRTVRAGHLIFIRYEETGKREPVRLSRQEVDLLP